jgi:hypothetical protein
MKLPSPHEENGRRRAVSHAPRHACQAIEIVVPLMTDDQQVGRICGGDQYTHGLTVDDPSRRCLQAHPIEVAIHEARRLPARLDALSRPVDTRNDAIERLLCVDHA